MSDTPLAQSISYIRIPFSNGLVAIEQEAERFRDDVANYDNLRGRSHSRVRRKLEELAFKYSETVNGLLQDPSYAGTLCTRNNVRDYVASFAVKICRLVLEDINEHSREGVRLLLWTELRTRAAPPQTDPEVLAFWQDGVMAVLKNHSASTFSDLQESDPLKAKVEFDRACDLLIELLLPISEPIWSEWLSLKIIAQRIGCAEEKMRSVKPRLIQINSQFHPNQQRQQHKVRLDTMDEPYRSAFKTE